MENKSAPVLRLILADDDKDDCLIFQEVLAELPVDTQLTLVHNGDQLMHELANTSAFLPDVLFLDLNMPRRDGNQCLVEIKSNPVLTQLPVIVYSTSYDQKTVLQLFDLGARFYIRKPCDFVRLKEVIYDALVSIREGRFPPDYEQFVLNANLLP